MTIPSPATRRVADNVNPNYTFAARSRLDHPPHVRNVSPTQSSSTSSSSSYPYSGDTGTHSSNTVLPNGQCGCGEATSSATPLLSHCLRDSAPPHAGHNVSAGHCTPVEQESMHSWGCNGNDTECCSDLSETLARQSSVVRAFREEAPKPEGSYARMHVGTALMGLLDRHRERRFHIAANPYEAPAVLDLVEDPAGAVGVGHTRSLSLSGNKAGKSDLKRLLDTHRKRREDLTGWQGPDTPSLGQSVSSHMDLMGPPACPGVEHDQGQESLPNHNISYPLDHVVPVSDMQTLPDEGMRSLVEHPFPAEVAETGGRADSWAQNIPEYVLDPLNDALLENGGMVEEIYSDEEFDGRGLSLPSEADTALRAYLARSLPASYKRQHPVLAEVSVPEPDPNRTSRRARSMEGYLAHGGFATKDEERRHANYVEMMDRYRCQMGMSGSRTPSRRSFDSESNASFQRHAARRSFESDSAAFARSRRSTDAASVTSGFAGSTTSAGGGRASNSFDNPGWGHAPVTWTPSLQNAPVVVRPEIARSSFENAAPRISPNVMHGAVGMGLPGGQGTARYSGEYGTVKCSSPVPVPGLPTAPRPNSLDMNSPSAAGQSNAARNLFNVSNGPRRTSFGSPTPRSPMSVFTAGGLTSSSVGALCSSTGVTGATAVGPSPQAEDPPAAKSGNVTAAAGAQVPPSPPSEQDVLRDLIDSHCTDLWSSFSMGLPESIPEERAVGVAGGEEQCEAPVVAASKELPRAAEELGRSQSGASSTVSATGSNRLLDRQTLSVASRSVSLSGVTRQALVQALFGSGNLGGAIPSRLGAPSMSAELPRAPLTGGPMYSPAATARGRLGLFGGANEAGEGVLETEETPGIGAPEDPRKGLSSDGGPPTPPLPGDVPVAAAGTARTSSGPMPAQVAGDAVDACAVVPSHMGAAMYEDDVCDGPPPPPSVFAFASIPNYEDPDPGHLLSASQRPPSAKDEVPCAGEAEQGLPDASGSGEDAVNYVATQQLDTGRSLALEGISERRAACTDDEGIPHETEFTTVIAEMHKGDTAVAGKEAEVSAVNSVEAFSHGPDTPSPVLAGGSRPITPDAPMAISPFAGAAPLPETPPILSPQATWEATLPHLTLAPVPEQTALPNDASQPRDEDMPPDSPASQREHAREMYRLPSRTASAPPEPLMQDAASPRWPWLQASTNSSGSSLAASPRDMGGVGQASGSVDVSATRLSGDSVMPERSPRVSFLTARRPPRVSSTSSLARSSSMESRGSGFSSASSEAMLQNHRRRMAPRVHSTHNLRVMARHSAAVTHSASFSGFESLLPLSPSPGSWSRDFSNDGQTRAGPIDLLLHGTPPPGDLGGPLGVYQMPLGVDPEELSHYMRNNISQGMLPSVAEGDGRTSSRDTSMDSVYADTLQRSKSSAAERLAQRQRELDMTFARSEGAAAAPTIPSTPPFATPRASLELAEDESRGNSWATTTTSRSGSCPSSDSYAWATSGSETDCPGSPRLCEASGDLACGLNGRRDAPQTPSVQSMTSFFSGAGGLASPRPPSNPRPGVAGLPPRVSLENTNLPRPTPQAPGAGVRPRTASLDMGMGRLTQNDRAKEAKEMFQGQRRRAAAQSLEMQRLLRDPPDYPLRGSAFLDMPLSPAGVNPVSAGFAGVTAPMTWEMRASSSPMLHESHTSSSGVDLIGMLRKTSPPRPLRLEMSSAAPSRMNSLSDMDGIVMAEPGEPGGTLVGPPETAPNSRPLSRAGSSWRVGELAPWEKTLERRVTWSQPTTHTFPPTQSNVTSWEIVFDEQDGSQILPKVVDSKGNPVSPEGPIARTKRILAEVAPEPGYYGYMQREGSGVVTLLEVALTGLREPEGQRMAVLSSLLFLASNYSNSCELVGVGGVEALIGMASDAQSPTIVRAGIVTVLAELLATVPGRERLEDTEGIPRLLDLLSPDVDAILQLAVLHALSVVCAGEPETPGCDAAVPKLLNVTEAALQSGNARIAEMALRWLSHMLSCPRTFPMIEPEDAARVLVTGMTSSSSVASRGHVLHAVHAIADDEAHVASFVACGGINTLLQLAQDCSQAALQASSIYIMSRLAHDKASRGMLLTLGACRLLLKLSLSCADKHVQVAAESLLRLLVNDDQENVSPRASDPDGQRDESPLQRSVSLMEPFSSCSLSALPGLQALEARINSIM